MRECFESIEDILDPEMDVFATEVEDAAGERMKLIRSFLEVFNPVVPDFGIITGVFEHESGQRVFWSAPCRSEDIANELEDLLVNLRHFSSSGKN